MYITVKLLIYSSFSACTAWYVNVRSKFLCIVTVSGYLYLMFCKLRYYYYTVHLMDQINDIWNTCYICLHLWDFTMYSLQKLLYYFLFSKHNLVVQNLSFTCLRWKGNFFNKTFANGSFLGQSVIGLFSWSICTTTHALPPRPLRKKQASVCCTLHFVHRTKVQYLESVS